MLEQVINLTDKWWSNVGQKEAMSIFLTTGTLELGAPTVVRILPEAKFGTYILTLCSLSSAR
jgi:hypothetical protein